MIAVKVRYHNILRRAAEATEETITVPDNASLRDVLEHLGDRHGSGLREMLFAPDGSVVSHLVAFRNRKLVHRDQHDDPLSDRDELMLFPAVAGG
jgi:molybdopterin converting factor small subunit